MWFAFRAGGSTRHRGKGPKCREAGTAQWCKWWNDYTKRNRKYITGWISHRWAGWVRWLGQVRSEGSWSSVDIYYLPYNPGWLVSSLKPYLVVMVTGGHRGSWKGVCRWNFDLRGERSQWQPCIQLWSLQEIDNYKKRHPLFRRCVWEPVIQRFQLRLV